MDARRDDDQAVSLVGWWKFARRAGDGGAFKLADNKSVYRNRQQVSEEVRQHLTSCAGGAIANLALAFHVVVIAQRSPG
jgi:hypothetical protein